MRGEGTTFNHWVCEERGGPTPIHPEPGRETSQRRSYWRLSAGNLGPRTLPVGDSLKTVTLYYRGVEQWQLVGLITRRSQVRILPPLPVKNPQVYTCGFCCLWLVTPPLA